MITWFSVVTARARRGVLGLALGLGGVGAARAEEPAAAPALGPKAQQKQELAETRLAAARAAAGAGKATEAHGLYGQSLAAGLAALGQAAADAEAPRPTSVTSLANEQPADAEAPAALETPAPPPEDEAAVAARQAERLARERAAGEAAARQAQRDEEARRQALAPTSAPVVVVATAPAPTRATPPTFQLGLRSALSAKDPDGGHHAGTGLVFTWLTLATAHGRGAVVVDLESTRWSAGRNDTMDRGQAGFYGLGFDWTLPVVAARGAGVFVGGEAAAGVLQGSSKASALVQTSGALQLMPHVGAALAISGVGLFADAGWRVQLTSDSASKANEGGLVVQGGLRVEMGTGPAAEPSGVDVGYTARLFAPNGSAIYARYGGGVFGASSGPLLEHELTLTTNAHLPARADAGLALTYLGAGRDGGGTGLSMLGLGVVGTWHAFETRQLFNPYLGLRLGLAYLASGDALTFRYSKQVGARAAGTAGVDVGLHRRVALRLGVAYDAVAYANDRANASLSGYAVEAGFIIRL